MKTLLIVPKTEQALRAGVNRWRTKLTLSTDHAASSYGHGVMLFPDKQVLDGATYLYIRELFGARIETTDPDRVCRALGLPPGEPGIEGIAAK